MDEVFYIKDGQPQSPPIVIKHELFTRIQRIAGNANMDVADLIQIVLKDVFEDPTMSLEKLAKLLRDLPDHEVGR